MHVNALIVCLQVGFQGKSDGPHYKIKEYGCIKLKLDPVTSENCDLIQRNQRENLCLKTCFVYLKHLILKAATLGTAERRRIIV